MTTPRYYRSDVSRLVWGVVIGLALLAGLWFAFSAQLRHARADERRQVLKEAAAVDSTLLRLQRRHYLAQLDSVRRVADRLRDSIEVRVRVVERVVPMIPDSLKQLPPIDSLVRACTRLARDCDALRVASARVDTLTDTLVQIDSTRLRAVQATVIATRDSVRTLQQRPRWRTVLGLTTLAALGGWLGGRR